MREAYSKVCGFVPINKLIMFIIIFFYFTISFYICTLANITDSEGYYYNSSTLELVVDALNGLELMANTYRISTEKTNEQSNNFIEIYTQRNPAPNIQP